MYKFNGVYLKIIFFIYSKTKDSKRKSLISTKESKGNEKQTLVRQSVNTMTPKSKVKLINK